MGSYMVNVLLLSIFYFVLDNISATKEFTHVEFALRIGTTGGYLYWNDDLNEEILHWLSVICAGYFQWHILRVIFIDRSTIFGWHHLCAYFLSLIAVFEYMPVGIMLMFSLMEIPNIFLFSMTYIQKCKPYYHGGRIFTLLNISFFVSWMYFRMYLALPLIGRFAFLDDVWQMRTPWYIIRTTQVCVFLLVILHLHWTWRMLKQAYSLLNF